MNVDYLFVLFMHKNLNELIINFKHINNFLINKFHIKQVLKKLF